MQRPDQRVARIAEPLPLRRMQLRDQLAGVALHALGDAAAVGLDEVHDEEIGIGIVDMRDRAAPTGARARPACRPRARGSTCRSRPTLPRLHRQAPPIGEGDRNPVRPNPTGRARASTMREPSFVSNFVLERAADHHAAVNRPPIANVTSLIQNHLKSATIVLKKRDEDEVQHEPGVRRHRALFISDLHLGTKACQAGAFLDFLRCHDAPQIYLVGDIVDFWRIKRGSYWPQSHNDVLQKLLRKVRKGTELVLIPGNHDEAFRDYCGMQIRRHRHRAQHRPCRRRRQALSRHPRRRVRRRRALRQMARSARRLELRRSRFGPTPISTSLRRWFGMPYWSLSAYLKQRVKRAVNYIGEFETALAQEARRHGAQGVICGHIHHAAMRQVGDIIYINTGDWVESCTAVAETEEGIFEIIRWTHPPHGMSTPEPFVEELEAAA